MWGDGANCVKVWGEVWVSVLACGGDERRCGEVCGGMRKCEKKSGKRFVGMEKCVGMGKCWGRYGCGGR